MTCASTLHIIPVFSESIVSVFESLVCSSAEDSENRKGPNEASCLENLDMSSSYITCS